jgi:hypothetical protein
MRHPSVRARGAQYGLKRKHFNQSLFRGSRLLSTTQFLPSAVRRGHSSTVPSQLSWYNFLTRGRWLSRSNWPIRRLAGMAQPWVRSVAPVGHKGGGCGRPQLVSCSVTVSHSSARHFK